MLTLFKVDTFHLQNPWFQVMKPLVLHPKTLGFATWNQCFQTVIWWVSETVHMHPKKWIFMQFWEDGVQPLPRAAYAASPSP